MFANIAKMSQGQRRSTVNKIEAKRRLANKKMSSTTQQALRTGGWANPASGSELKFTDLGASTSLANSAITWSTPTQICRISPGTGPSDRIGRKLRVTKLYLRWWFGLNNTNGTVTGSSPLRVIVVYDKQCNGVAMPVTDLLLTDGFLSANNLTYRDRFVVLMDFLTPSISSTATKSVAGSEIKNTSLEVLYNTGPDGLVGSISSGAFYIMCAYNGQIANGDSGTAAYFNYSIRCRYKDD